MRVEIPDSPIINERESGKGKKLGDILLEDHFIEENKLIEVLADQLGFPQVKPDLSDVDRKLMEKANPNWFLQRHFLPLQIRDNQVLVAFGDPLDQHARQEAARLFGTDLTPLIASKRIIRETIEAYQRHYQTSIGPTIQTEATQPLSHPQSPVEPLHGETLATCFRFSPELPMAGRSQRLQAASR
jgi:hypothetical protein